MQNDIGSAFRHTPGLKHACKITVSKSVSKRHWRSWRASGSLPRLAAKPGAHPTVRSAPACSPSPVMTYCLGKTNSGHMTSTHSIAKLDHMPSSQVASRTHPVAILPVLATTRGRGRQNLKTKTV